MASLRQRLLGNQPKLDVKGEKEEEEEESKDGAEEVRLAPASKIHGHHKKSKRRNGLIFALGGLAGLLAAGFFAQQSDLIEFPEFGDLSMDSLMDVLPAGFVKEARDLAVSFPLHKRI